jgi:hypothetical protein
VIFLSFAETARACVGYADMTATSLAESISEEMLRVFGPDDGVRQARSGLNGSRSQKRTARKDGERNDL